ncbi:MAG: DUF4760 domain-containing protein [Aestuariivirgaceae bacterium]
MNDPSHIGRLSLPVTHWLIAGLTIGVLTAAYWLVTGDAEKTIIFFALAATAGATVLNAVYMARSVREVLRDRSSREEVEKIRRALSFGQRWNEPAMFRVRDKFNTILRQHNEGRGPDAILEADADEMIVAQGLNFLEELAYAKEKGIVDGETARNQFEGIVIGVWQALAPWIDRRRELRRRPKIWCRFQAV